MNRIIRSAVLMLFICTCGGTQFLFAQMQGSNQEGLVREWVEKDKKNMALLLSFFPFEYDSPEEMLEFLKRQGVGHLYQYFEYEEEKAFGISNASYSLPGGYTSFFIQLKLIDGRMDRCVLGIRCHKWAVLKKRIFTPEIERILPEIEEGDNGFSIVVGEGKWESVLRQRTDAYFGPSPVVVVREELGEEYEYLRSPNSNLALGDFCYVVGTPPCGRIEIEYFLEPEYLDVLASIGRGYNDEGRAYAVLAILEMEQRGYDIPANCRQVIEKNLALGFDVEMCLGCEFDRRPIGEVIKRHIVDFSEDMSDRMEDK